MDELERLREIVSKVRQAAKGAQTWHTVLDPYEVLEIVGREESKLEIVITPMAKLEPTPTRLPRFWRNPLRRRSES